MPHILERRMAAGPGGFFGTLALAAVHRAELAEDRGPAAPVRKLDSTGLFLAPGRGR